MHCADLERYLEAHIDGRLGRNRSAILQRHLSGCERCRARVEQLRHFEKDLQSRFRTMKAEAALWDNLETTLVAEPSSKPREQRPSRPIPTALIHPTPTPGLAEDRTTFRSLQKDNPGEGIARERNAGESVSDKAAIAPWPRYMTAFAVLLIGAVGFYGYTQWQSERSLVAFSEQEPGLGLDMRTADGFILRNWLGNQLGYPLPPTPLPQGFSLLGGSVAERDDGASAIIAYDSPMGPAILHVRRSESGLSFDNLVDNYASRGMQALSWQADRFDYAVFAGAEVMGLSAFRR